MPRIHIGDGFSKLSVVQYDLWAGVTVTLGGKTSPIQRIFYSPDFSPTLILKWASGGSTDFDVELWTYFDVGDVVGLENEKIPVVTSLTSVGTNGKVISIRELGFSTPIIYGWGEIYVINNDAGNDLGSLSGRVYLSENN